MSESQVTVGEWIGFGMTAILAALGGTFAGAKYGKQELTAKIETVEVQVTAHILHTTEKHGAQAMEIRAVQICQENTRDGLERIEATTQETNKKLDTLIQSMLNKH